MRNILKGIISLIKDEPYQYKNDNNYEIITNNFEEAAYKSFISNYEKLTEGDLYHARNYNN